MSRALFRRSVITSLLAACTLLATAATGWSAEINQPAAGGTTLEFNGTAANDVVTITQPAPTTILFDAADALTVSGVGAGTDCSEAAGNVTCTGQTWTEIALALGDGDDVVDARTVAVKLDGSGDAGNDTLEGGAGDDYLVGGAGNDTLRGGDGNDTLAGAGGIDALDGGAGRDQASYQAEPSAVTVDLAAGTGGTVGALDTLTSIEDVLGSPHDDTLLGDAGNNDISGNAGNDTIDGRGGFDELSGDAGNDTVTSTDDSVDLVSCAGGTDVANLDHLDQLSNSHGCETVNRAAAPSNPSGWPITGTDANDKLTGTTSADTILGFGGDDRLTGLAGNDELRGGFGNDDLRGNAGNDELHGGFGNDKLNGHSGADDLFGSNGADTLIGSSGNDELRGGNGKDVMNGGSGNDRLYGGNGADRLIGGSGNDILVGGTGLDNLNGGPGKDTLISRDGRRRDVVTCTKVNLASRRLRAQRDTVIADRGDIIRNRAWCARVFIF